MGKYRTAARQALEALRAGISYWRHLRAGGRPLVVRVDGAALGAVITLERLVSRVYSVLNTAPARHRAELMRALSTPAGDAVCAVESLRAVLRQPRVDAVATVQVLASLAGRKRVAR